VIDADGIVRYASPAFAALTGARTSDPTIGTRVDAQIHPDDRGAVERIARSVLAEDGRTVTFECRVHHRTNGWRTVEVTATNRMREPAVHGIVVNARDITERVEAAARLAHQAMHDTLTGLPNRALFLDRLDNAVARAERSGRPCAVLFLDLDRFKQINDGLGHAAGDQVLTTVAERLAGEVRPGDSVARLGGDEFVVLAENVDHPRVALEIAERIRSRLSEPIALVDRLVATACSVGIALSDRNAPGGLLQEADMALYRAKSAGRNRCELYDQAMRAQARQRLEVEELIRGAVGTDALQVHFQPIVDLRTGRMNGTEALARILHPDGRLVGPAEFLAVAEESGLIIPLGTAVLR
ncbi:MAG: putative bifunctional diguanylate cyclase/phosphodiesterase, partial [Actinomycetes bacterium]